MYKFKPLFQRLFNPATTSGKTLYQEEMDRYFIQEFNAHIYDNKIKNDQIKLMQLHDLTAYEASMAKMKAASLLKSVYTFLQPLQLLPLLDTIREIRYTLQLPSKNENIFIGIIESGGDLIQEILQPTPTIKDFEGNIDEEDMQYYSSLPPDYKLTKDKEIKKSALKAYLNINLRQAITNAIEQLGGIELINDNILEQLYVLSSDYIQESMRQFNITDLNIQELNEEATNLKELIATIINEIRDTYQQQEEQAQRHQPQLPARQADDTEPGSQNDDLASFNASIIEAANQIEENQMAANLEDTINQNTLPANPGAGITLRPLNPDYISYQNSRNVRRRRRNPNPNNFWGMIQRINQRREQRQQERSERLSRESTTSIEELRESINEPERRNRLNDLDDLP